MNKKSVLDIDRKMVKKFEAINVIESMDNIFFSFNFPSTVDGPFC